MEIYTFNPSYDTTRTGYNVSKPNGGHGNEAKVKSIKECQVFNHSEEVGTNAEKETENQKTTKSCFDVPSKSHIFIFLPGIITWK